MAIKAKKTNPKVVLTPVESTVIKSKPSPKFITYLVIVILLGVSLFLLSKKYRGLIIAGTVNSSPITRWELSQALTDRYGKATLDELIATKLLNQLAASNQITVSKDDISKELQALETRLGGKEALQASMTQFGIDEKKLNQEISAVLIQKKLSEKLFKVTVEDAEVTKYFNDNKALFTNKKFDDVKADIKLTLEQQKLQEQFGTWFQDQQKKALIKTFI